MPTHALHEVVLEPVVCTAVLTVFRTRMESISFENLKARNYFAVGCRIGAIISETAAQGSVTGLEQTPQAVLAQLEIFLSTSFPFLTYS